MIVRLARRIALDLCRVSLGGDLHERAAEQSLSLPLSRPRARRIDRMRKAGILFVHVPKCAGMAISQALYGMQVKHGTIRWYRQCAPDLLDLPSFAVVRDPVERFVSAYRYALAGGTGDNRVSPVFHDVYRRFRGLDEALDHIEAAPSLYELDHIFRPQHWYIEGKDGAIGVRSLFCVEDPALPLFIEAHGGGSMAQVNRNDAPRVKISSWQADRIRALYGKDVALHAAVVRGETGTWLGRKVKPLHPGGAPSPESLFGGA